MKLNSKDIFILSLVAVLFAIIFLTLISFGITTYAAAISTAFVLIGLTILGFLFAAILD